MSYVSSKDTDSALKAIKDIKRLYKLDLWGSQITDKGLEHLSSLSNLHSLNLGVSRITDKGLIMIDPYSDFGNKLVSVDIE